MDSQFRMGMERTYDGSETPAIRIDVNICFNDNASPTLTGTIFKSLGEFIAATCSPETSEEIAREMMEHAEKKRKALQLEADAAARSLIGDAPEENAGGS